MRLQFNGSQDYQLQAIRSVVDIFEGQPLAKNDFGLSASTAVGVSFSEKGVANRLVINEAQILRNVQHIQASNGIPPSDTLISSVSDDGQTEFCRFNFTVEMETGTGKTYTFLRSIYELHKVYGFRKFVIVVPSVAIREGTLKNLQITHEHFQHLYDNPLISYLTYDRNNLTALRNFATSNTIQILVINIDSFTKDSNVINTIGESGIKPIEYIQHTHPVVIVDEPQNFETDIRRQAIDKLNPLCTLRYSATHRNLYNLIYSLNPVQAYDLGLVKQIEVDGITHENYHNHTFIQCVSIRSGKTALKAKLVIYVNENKNFRQKEITVHVGDDLLILSNGMEIYKDGFVIDKMNAKDGIIEFANGQTIKVGETQGGLTDEIMKFQIERTVYWHFKKVQALKDTGIKVLSLFFIDSVANYRLYDSEGNFFKGKLAIWFEKAFSQWKAHNPGLIPFEASEVHNGYFSSDKIGKGKDKKDIWTDTKGTTAKDSDTYSLIMKDKERLLSIEEPLQFIFSHSALREGWDNPNIFQICTLNESKSDLKKRQEIGRGLRLSVNAEGVRVQDKDINILTVIANETYEDFSKALQKEIQQETSVTFNDRIKNAREKVVIRKNKKLIPENFPLLFDIWDKISRQTRYFVNYSTEELISHSVCAIQHMPTTVRPTLDSQTTRLNYSEKGIKGDLKEINRKGIETESYSIPDIYGYIQSKVNITRNTIYEILTRSGRLEEVMIDPQIYLDRVVSCIQQAFNHLLTEEIYYEEIKGKAFDITLFDLEEKETFVANLFRVTQTEKTIFNYIPVNSHAEREFAAACEADENVQFFFKLPQGFYVPTPVGNDMSGWAVILGNDSKKYFVVQIPESINVQVPATNLYQIKVNCMAKHFALFRPLGIEYRLATMTKDLQ